MMDYASELLISIDSSSRGRETLAAKDSGAFPHDDTLISGNARTTPNPFGTRTPKSPEAAQTEVESTGRKRANTTTAPLRTSPAFLHRKKQSLRATGVGFAVYQSATHWVSDLFLSPTSATTKAIR
jgi:hypothetical protein